jgi:NAD(P)-dependent dehydrogenase (short-subunit alcohol dehydrogenase family)
MTERKVLITGADGGLGRDMTAHLAKRGWSFILLDRNDSIHDLPGLLSLPSDRAGDPSL